MKNCIVEYYDKISSGQIVAGKLIIAIYTQIIKGLETGLYYFDQKKATKAIRFIEAFVHHSKGRSDLLKLELWEKAAISCIFGIMDNSGLRQFREVFIVIARKNGKSLLAAAIIAYTLYLDGEFGAEIYCLAPKLDQSDIVYTAFWNSVEMEPELAELTKRRKSDLYVADTKSFVKKLAFNYKKADGFNPHLSICDEIASWQGEQGLRQYEVIASALGAREQPLIVSITTAGYVEGSIYDELFARATRVLKGTSKETRLLPLIYQIDDINKWHDPEELKKSNPNLGVSVTADFLMEEAAKAEVSLSKKAEFLTKYCNIKQNAATAWLNAEDVEACFGDPISLDDFRDMYATAGIDLSQTTDLTSVIIDIERDGTEYIFAKFYMPEEKIDEASERDGIPYRAMISRGYLETSGQNYVDYHDIYNFLVQLVEEYKIYPLMSGYDRYSSQYLIQDLEKYGFRTDDVYQGYNLTPVIRETEGAIKDRKIYCGDNQLLKIHLLDTAVKTEIENNRCKLAKVSAKAHIDGAAALVDARTVRMKWADQYGYQLSNNDENYTEE